jgi:ATP-dependent DNA helicase
VRTDEGDEVNFKENPRITALEQTLEPILEAGEKCIIWAVFHQNYTAIADLLNKMKVKFVELHGKTSEKDRQKNVDAFNKDPDTRVLIGHPGSGGIGISLTSASYSIYYSRGFSLEYDLQSEARNYRGGSEIHSKITRIDLVTPGTIDDLILEKLASKQAISGKVLMEMVEEMKNEK